MIREGSQVCNGKNAKLVSIAETAKMVLALASINMLFVIAVTLVLCLLWQLSFHWLIMGKIEHRHLLLKLSRTFLSISLYKDLFLIAICCYSFSLYEILFLIAVAQALWLLWQL